MSRYEFYIYIYKQLNNKSVYKNVTFKEKFLQDLAETSNNIFKSLRGKGKITEKQLKYFTIADKKAANLGKMYLLPKIHKRLLNVSVISNCGLPTEKVSEFLDSHLNSFTAEADII